MDSALDCQLARDQMLARRIAMGKGTATVVAIEHVNRPYRGKSYGFAYDRARAGKQWEPVRS